jgi:hypothetical protein
MSMITELLREQLSGDAISHISNKIGSDESTTSKAIASAVPMLIAALARNSAQPQGAQALHQALVKDHDGGILDNVMSFLGNSQASGGVAILQHLVGNQRPAVEHGLAQSTGLEASSAARLLEILAPMVMGALGKTQQKNGFDSQGLSTFLGDQHQAAQAEAPQATSFITNLLDANNDGSVVDDVGRLIIGKLFGN